MIAEHRRAARPGGVADAAAAADRGREPTRDRQAGARARHRPAKGQEFQVTDAVPFAPLDGITLDQALEQAYATRPDYLSARAQVRAAELARQSAAAANYPSLSADARLWRYRQSRTSARRAGPSASRFTLHVPIFQGTRVRADTLQADADTRAASGGTGGSRTAGSTQQVRTAFLNLKSSSDLVAVSREQCRARQPDARAGARSVFRRRRRQPRGRASAGVGGRGQSVLHREPLCATTSRRSRSPKRSALPSSRRSPIWEPK